MAKGQMRGNREIRKPKQEKKPAAVTAPILKGSTEPIKPLKKKH